MLNHAGTDFLIKRQLLTVKRTLKILWLTAVAVTAIILAGILAIQTPQVQTYLASKVVKRLSEKIDAEISFEKIHFKPFNTIVLKNIAIVDRTPCDTSAPDTLFRSEYTIARFTLKGLRKQEGLHIRRAFIRNAAMNLVIEDDETNLQRMFGLEKNPDKEKSDKNIFDIRRVEIDGMSFCLNNFRSEDSTAVQEGHIDWKDLHVSDIRISARRLKLSGGVMSGTLDFMSFKEKSGYICNSISGEARVGNGKTILENVHISDPWSDVSLLSFIMSYEDSEDFKDFTREVRLDADIDDSRLSMKTLSYFASGLSGNSFTARIQGKASGEVDDLSLDNLLIDAGSNNISGIFSGKISGLPDISRMYLDLKAKQLKFSTKGLDTFISQWSGKGSGAGLSGYAAGERFSVDGNIRGRLDRLSVILGVHSSIGKIYADISLSHLISKTKSIRIAGNLKTADLDIGKAIGNNMIHECTLEAGLQASLGNRDGAPELTIDSLFIDRLNFNRYDYSGIAAKGKIAKEAFDGKIVCNDPNLNFMFQGLFNLSRRTSNALYKFYMNVGYADLNAMNFDKRGISRIRFRTTANFNWIQKSGDLLGDIDIAGLVLENMMGKHEIGEININSYSSNDIYRMSFSSDFADATYTGTGSLPEFIKDFQAVTLRRELPSMFRDSLKTDAKGRYRLSVKTYDTMDLLSFLAPGVYIADSTSLYVGIDTTGIFNASLSSQRIAYKEQYIKDVDLHIDNSDGAIKGELGSGSLRFATLMLKNNRMVFFADDDHLGIGLSYDNRSTLSNRGEFFAIGDISRDTEDKMALDVSILPSSIYLNDREWSISPSKFRICGKEIDVDILEFLSGDQAIRVTGSTSAEKDSRLTLNLDRFDISIVNPLLKKDLAIKGALTGQAILDTPYSNLGLQMDFLCDSTSIAGSSLGTVTIAGSLDNIRKSLGIKVSNNIDGAKTLDIDGSYGLKSKNADFNILLDRFDIACATPFVSSVISQMSGYVSGRFSADGPLDRLTARSENAGFENAILRIAFTNVPYLLNGGFRMDETGIYFDRISIEDSKGGNGLLTGNISYDHFKDIRFNARADVLNIEAINLDASQSETFYGNVSATGSVEFSGPMNALQLTVNAATSGDGQFHIPLSSSSNATGSNLLTFKEPVVIKKVDPYEAMVQRLQSQEKRESDFRMKLRVAANQGTEAFIEIDKATGNVLSGRGDGVIDIDLQPKKDIFNITGDYTIASGNYRFVALGFASRDFSIQDGSSVKFYGDIMESTLDIDARYTTKASLSTLIADTTSVANRRVVECGISITDKISNPRLKFSISIPDLDPTIQSRVESALSTEDKVQKQFLSLIISNSFLPDEQSGIVNNSSILYSNVTDIMTNQLNNIFQKLDIPLDLGLNYQPNDKGNDIFDVAVSTQLFNNRVIVNGNIGNRQYNSGSSGSDVVGDLDIEIKLTRSGALRLTLFSHSADEYTNYLDNSQRNGIGIAYQKEFDRFDTFIRNIFRSRKKREEEERQELMERRNMERNVIIIESRDEDRKPAGIRKERSRKRQ